MHNETVPMIRKLAFALALVSTTATLADTVELQSSVVRINGKRYKKVQNGASALYVPSMGTPVASSVLESVCPQTLGPSDEVLQISKPVAADDEINAASKQIVDQMAACTGAAAKAGETAKKTENDCDKGTVEPKIGADGKVQEGTGTIKVGCGKKFGKP